MVAHDRIRLNGQLREAPASAGASYFERPATRVGDNQTMALTVDAHVAITWIERARGGARERVRDEIAVEEPLEIRVDGTALAVTMRTPGEDEELAAGFLAGEGLIAEPSDVTSAGPTEELEANTVDVRTRSGLRRDPSAERSFYLSSSCGVCGKGAIEFVRQEAPRSLPGKVSPELVLAAPEAARSGQRGFERTGGLHATALFEPEGGSMLVLREDVGRHNAMDKALGSMLLAGRYPLPGVIACLSGRASFELVQKASLAGLAGVIAVGAPSTLAVDLATERGMLLCGFVRDGSFNVYSGAERLAAG
jgi:FdhD protein